MVRAVAAEWIVNINVCNDPTITKPDDEFVLFPRAQTIALEGAIASGLFTPKTDKAFLTRATRLRQFLSELNHKLEFTEQRLSDRPTEISTWRQKISKGVVLKQVRHDLHVFAKLLISDYGIKESDSFYEEILDDANEKPSAHEEAVKEGALAGA